MAPLFLMLAAALGCLSPSGAPGDEPRRGEGGGVGGEGVDGGEGGGGVEGGDEGDEGGGDSGDSDSDSDSGGGGGDTGDPPRPAPQGLLIAQSWDVRDTPTGAGAGEYRVIVLQESMHTLLPEIRAANPEAAILAYQKVGGMRADGGEHASTGVRIDQAAEAWFLHGLDGQRLDYCDYAGVAAADIGHPGYQAAWLETVRTRLARDGFDGVMMDDVNVFPGHCLGERGGTPIAEYPTDAAYGAAVVDFMLTVGPELRRDGLLVAPNIAMNPWEPEHRALALAMLPGMTHWLREYWMRWDDSANFTGTMWSSTLDLMLTAQAEGVGFLALTLGPGEEGAAAGVVYGRASWLLAFDGAHDSAWGYLDASGGDPWTPDWGSPPGDALGPAEAEGVGWRREFDEALVILNPSDAAAQVFALGGGWRLPDGSTPAHVTLGPAEARVLARR